MAGSAAPSSSVAFEALPSVVECDGKLPSCEVACAAPDQEACVGLGLALTRGPIDGRDYERATKLFSTACEVGSARGCFELGRRLGSFRAAPRGQAAALDLFQRACDDGLAAACGYAGTARSLGRGGVGDPRAARALYQRGCGGGDARSCTRLAAMHFEGDGGPEDKDEGVRVLEARCAEPGGQEACDALGWYLESGSEVPVDMARAIRLYRGACDAGVASGCTNLAFAFTRRLRRTARRHQGLRAQPQGVP